MVDSDQPIITEPQDEPEYHMIPLGGDYVTVSGMTKHYVTLINEAIIANPRHPMVEGMELGRYLNVIVASDGGVPSDDFKYLLQSLPESELDEEVEEELTDRQEIEIRNLIDGAGWTYERAYLKVTGKLPGGVALKTTVSNPTPRPPRKKRRYHHVSKVPDADSDRDPYWRAGDGPVVLDADQEMHLAALRAASIADVKRLRAQQEAILHPPEVKKAPALTPWKPEDAQLLKQMKGMSGFYPEAEIEAKAFKRMNGNVHRMFNGLGYFDDLAYRQGLATNAEKKAKLEEEAKGFVEVLNQSLDAKGYAWDIIHLIDENEFGDNYAFAKAFPFDDLLKDANLRAKLGVLGAFRDKQRIVEGEKTAEGDIDSPASMVEVMTELIHQSLGDMSVGAIRKLATELVKDKDRQFDYWRDRLGEAKEHDYVRDLLEDELEKVDDRVAEAM